MPPCQANFILFVETESCFVVEAGLELMASSDPPASASQWALNFKPLRRTLQLILYLKV